MFSMKIVKRYNRKMTGVRWKSVWDTKSDFFGIPRCISTADCPAYCDKCKVRWGTCCRWWRRRSTPSDHWGVCLYARWVKRTESEKQQIHYIRCHQEYWLIWWISSSTGELWLTKHAAVTLTCSPPLSGLSIMQGSSKNRSFCPLNRVSTQVLLATFLIYHKKNVEKKKKKKKISYKNFLRKNSNLFDKCLKKGRKSKKIH